MRLIGIDYGEKRIGIALSDESGAFAFPHSVIINCSDCAILNVAQIKKICGENDVGKIILGESLDYKGKPNPIMKKIEKFKVLLEKEINLPVIYQSEILTTKEAERIIGKTKKTDASAAALILRSYIDKEKML